MEFLSTNFGIIILILFLIIVLLGKNEKIRQSAIYGVIRNFLKSESKNAEPELEKLLEDEPKKASSELKKSFENDSKK
jgi:Sec-independent protein translocase protein TatA